LWQAVWNSLAMLAVSISLGALFGIAVPGLLRRLGQVPRDATLAFAIAVILLVTFTHAFRFSPILATLTFGIMARHRRVVLSQAQRNFGALGDLLTVVLFVFVTAALDWTHVIAGMGIGLVLVGVRLAVKAPAVLLFARVSGISWRKGILTGMALMPMSVFAILLLEHERYIGIELPGRLAALAAMTLLLEVIGPVMTQRALITAGETPDPQEG
jgi:Kef-type K+ transport system membrane component KefB